MTEKNVFTAQNIGDLTAEQYEGVERGILDMIEMTGEVVLTGKASMVLWQVAAGMAYKGQLTREMFDDRHVFRLARPAGIETIADAGADIAKQASELSIRAAELQERGREMMEEVAGVVANFVQRCGDDVDEEMLADLEDLVEEMHERGGEIQEHGVSLLHMAGRLAATGHWMSK